MYLKTLELLGFKSFAKKSLLEFNTPISAIVGPNGSGKSNIAEAFRFVLGEQSIKSLRGKRGEDLIFNGSGATARASRASVKVVFDNAKRILPVDFDEVSIERVVYRDSSNEYFINGSQVRLKDILELLASAHVGASGHHIISQGEADRILSVNLKERKGMIEEALGLKIYHTKKQESLRRLQKTEENIQSVESLRREITPHLKFLKKQVEKIEQAKVMRDELTALYREYFKREAGYLSHMRAAIVRERELPEARMRELEEVLQDARATLVSEDSGKKEAAEILSLESRLKAARERKDALVRECGRLEGEIHAEEKNIARFEEMSAISAEISVPLRDVEELSEKIHRYSMEAQMHEEPTRLREMIASIWKAVFDFLTIHRGGSENRYRQQIETAQSERSRLEARKESLEGEIRMLVQEEELLGREYQIVKETIEQDKDSKRDAEKEVFRIVAEQNELRGTLAALRARENSLENEEANFKRELEEAAILAGRQAVAYEDAVIVDATGAVASEEEFSRQPRSLQEERRRKIEKIKIRLEDQGIGSVEDVMKEYHETAERDAFLAREIEDLHASAQTLQSLIAELEEKLEVEFKEGIKKINTQFQEFFSGMFGGGRAELAVVREHKRKSADTDLGLLDDESGASPQVPEEALEEGLDINVSLPHKKTRGLVMLSGGERALTSIALLFAISQVNPPPFIILDETDAALDEANSRKYSAMIKNLAQYSQLILITHNRETMSAAGILYGITMGSDGASKLLSVAFEEAVKVAK